MNPQSPNTTLGSAPRCPIYADDIHGPDDGLDQNRLFVGINRVMNEHVNLDAGYQFQSINTSESGIFNDKRSILLLQIFLTW